MAFGTTDPRGPAARKGAPPSRRSRAFAPRLIGWTAFTSAIVAVCVFLMFVPLAAAWLLAGKLSDHESRRSEDRTARAIYLGPATGGGPARIAGLTPAEMKDLDRVLSSPVEEQPDTPPSVVAEATPVVTETAPPATSIAPPPRAKPVATVKVEKPRLVAVVPPPAAPAPAVREKTAVAKLFDKVLRREPQEERDDDIVGSVSAYANPDLPRGDETRTAVYDISGHTVYMPNGERLEAHSGLGQNRDNPASYRLRMRGVTPPNVYRLSMRERLFHGVAAIRLNPLDGAAMNGRDGMLAHTYMLGPNGDSNGCVSFRSYDRFLAAFRRGEVTRMIVVSRMTGTPAAVIAAHRHVGRYAAERSGISER